MKKLIIIAVSILLIVAFAAGCSESNQMSFQATISEVSTGSILVTPAEGSDELRSSDLISASISDKTKLIGENGKKCDISAFKKGMTVKITYNGMIMDSYPAKIFADSIKIIG